MEIKTLDNKFFIGENHLSICIALWKSMFNPDPTFEEWMVGSSYRAMNWNGSIIRCTDAEAHLNDLIENEIVELLED